MRLNQRFFGDVRRSSCTVLLLAAIILFASCATGIPESEVAPLYYNLGNAYFELGEYDQAAEAYLRAIELDKSLVRANYNLVQVFLEKKEFARAKTYLQELIAEDPENATLLSTLGYILTMEGNLAKALQIFQDILERDPKNIDALYNTAVIYWKLEEFTEAREVFLEVFEEEPNDAETVYNLALLEERLGNSERAIEYLQTYTSNKPDDLEAKERLADIYNEEELYAKALELYDQILKKDESRGPVLFKKAYILLTVVGNIEEGMSYLERAILAGFKEQEKYKQLVEHPDLLERERIENYIREKNLLPAD